MIFVSNAFSRRMLGYSAQPCVVTFSAVSLEQAQALLRHPDGYVHGIGHQQAAEDYSTLLGVDLPCQRIDIALGSGDVLLFGEPVGGRLAEGAVAIAGDRAYQFYVAQVV
jgi:hypothetical protein